MKAANWRTWSWQYVLPIVILALGLPLAWLLGAEDPDIVWALLIAPLLAFLIGLLMRPRHAWLVPAIVVGAFLIIGGLNDPSRLPVLVAGMFFFAFLPLVFLIWAGKAMRSWLGKFRQHPPSA